MKRRVFLLLTLILFVFAALPARAEETPQERMLAAAAAGDAEAGHAAEAEQTGNAVRYDDLSVLARAIYAVTGQREYEDWLRMAVGEVVLNRLSSPEFPDTLREVVDADTRYSGVADGYFDALRPDRSCAEAALRLLSGERVMNDPKVVYQNSHIYDGGLCLHIYDYRMGDVYFCYTTHPELYGEE